MDHLIAGREALAKALSSGASVAPEEAARYPDVILRQSGEKIPDWILPAMRRPTQPDGPRYVVANDEAFHVSFNGGGALVLRVSQYEQNHVHKIVHDPYGIDDEDHSSALAAYALVNNFVKNPDTLRWKFTAKQNELSDLDSKDPSTSKRPTRTSLRT